MSFEFLRTTLATLLLLTFLGSSVSGPVPKNTIAEPLPMKFLKSSKENVNFHRLPPSPANLLKPDGFQFYAYNEKGDMITRQMTVQEIQALIAGGGPDHSNLEIQEPQKVEDILTGGKKVIDVVEKVQSVLKSAMDKPLSTLSGPLPAIPEKANVEWSNILPAILAGDKYGNKVEDSYQVDDRTNLNPMSASSTVPTDTPATSNDAASPEIAGENVTRDYEPLTEATRSPATDSSSAETVETTTTGLQYTEKLMIPVSVVTTDRDIEQSSQSVVPQTTTQVAPLTSNDLQELSVSEKEATSTTMTEIKQSPTTCAPSSSTLESIQEKTNSSSTSFSVSSTFSPIDEVYSEEAQSTPDSVSGSLSTLERLSTTPSTVQTVGTKETLNVSLVSTDLPKWSDPVSTESVSSSTPMSIPVQTGIDVGNLNVDQRNNDSQVTLLSETEAIISLTPASAPEGESGVNANDLLVETTPKSTILDLVSPTKASSLDTSTSDTVSLKVSNSSGSVALIDSILRTVSPNTSPVVTEAYAIPNNLPDGVSSNTLASSLIAGFADRTSATKNGTVSSTEKLGLIGAETTHPSSESLLTVATLEGTTTSKTPVFDAGASSETPSTKLSPISDILANDTLKEEATASPESSTVSLETVSTSNVDTPVAVSGQATTGVPSVQETLKEKNEQAGGNETIHRSESPHTNSQEIASTIASTASSIEYQDQSTVATNSSNTEDRPMEELNRKHETLVSSSKDSLLASNTTASNSSKDEKKNPEKVSLDGNEEVEKQSGAKFSTTEDEIIDKPSSNETQHQDRGENKTRIDESSTNSTSQNLWQEVPLRQTTSTLSSMSSSSSSSSPTRKPEASIPGNSSSKVETNLNEPTSVSLVATKDTTGGLDSSTRNASTDIVNFSRLCNELAMKFWTSANKGLSTARSLALSPFGMVSLLAMIFLGARGSTSDQMNEVLGLDNVATFNPHLIFQNITDTVSLARHQGIANAAFVRELFADKLRVRKLLPFYKEQVQQFYEGLVAEVNFATISDLVRRRTNLLVRKQTGGRIKDFVKGNAVQLRSPLAAISANVFQTDCNASLASTTGRDGELYFAVSSAHRLRKLIPVPATVWRSNVLAGYEPNLDATAVALGGVDKLVSTIFLLPGQQGHVAPGDTLDRLEQRLVKGEKPSDESWNKLLKVLIPRPGLELQIPKFSHRSIVNATAALKRMGLDQLFSSHADFKGINGVGNRLHLSDVLQMNLFSTCGDENIANGRHHVEIYPASPSIRSSWYDESNLDGGVAGISDVQSQAEHTVSRREAQRMVERSDEKPRLKLDQPFLYFVRHNPTGLILHMGRFNPRLL